MQYCSYLTAFLFAIKAMLIYYEQPAAQAIPVNKDIQQTVQEESNYAVTTSVATLPNKITSYTGGAGETATGYTYLDPASSQLFTQTQRIALQVK